MRDEKGITWAGSLDDGWVKDSVEEEDIWKVASERTGDPVALVVELAVVEELPTDEVALLDVGVGEELVRWKPMIVSLESG